MASSSIIGGQYQVVAPGGQQLNVVMTKDGNNLPAPISGEFNLEVITDGVVPAGPAAGYQGVAVLSDDGQTINMAYGDWALTLTGQSDPTVIGGTGNDTITAGDAPALIVGGSGSDLIHGGDGPDTIQGGSGSDTIYGGNGPDLIYGGNGPDTIYGGNGPDTIYGGNGPDLIAGGTGSELIYGGSGNDTIQGGSGNDTIHVGTGATLIQDTGAAGHDTIVGFDASHGDAISFVGENTATINQVVATATVQNDNTTVTLPDGSTMTLVGVTHIDHTFFH